MDEGTREIDSWRRVCLGDEPLYCPAPSPSSSDDIICPGSDEEVDESTKAAKRLRYEEQGRRYLQGRPPRILSASLRGPFDKASGWQNPWLPKASTQHQQFLIPSSRSLIASAVVQYESNIQAVRMSGKEHDTIHDPDDSMDDSMDCHLPSPQSHENLPIFDSPSHVDRHSRIESWAEHVHGVTLEKDEFWAPDHDLENYNNEAVPKRPAGRDWLKRRPAKRKRPDLSQSTAATSTPTPIPTTQSKSRNKNNPITVKRTANRSFEMTTPSSSTDQGPRESPGTVKRQPVASDDEEQPMSSTMSTEDSRSSTEPLLEVRLEEEYVEAMEDMSHKQQKRDGPQNDEEIDDISDFQNCADNSFCYRARQPKQATPPSGSSETAAGLPSQLTQTETPVSSRHDNAVIVLSNSDANLTTTSNFSNVNNIEHVEGSSVPAIADATNNGAGEPIVAAVGPVHNRWTWEEVVLQKCSITDTGADRNSASGVSIGRPLRDITSSNDMSRLNTYNPIPQTLFEVKNAQSVSAEPLLDEGSTLIGDPMEMEQPGYIQPTQQNCDDYPSHDSSLDQRHSTSAIELADKIAQCGYLTAPNKVDEAASCIVAAISQPGATGLQSKTSSPMSQSSQGEMANSVIGADPVESRDTIVGNQTVPCEQQSPWVPTFAISESVKTGGDDTGQVEGKVTELSALPVAILLDSPALLHKSPAIRPSQQSPWVQEVIEPAITTKQEEDTSVNMAVIMETESTKECQSPLPSTAGKEGISPSIEGFLYTPVPQIARQSTPEPEVSIKSFSNFNFFPPQRSGCTPASSIIRGILSSRKYPSTTTSIKSSRRVSFAPLPHEQDDNSNQLSSAQSMRAASPPPPSIVDLDEENVDGKYRNHFDVMNRRLSVHAPPNLRYQRRLLPSSSQQPPESPSIEAMAEAFRVADAYQSGRTEDIIEGKKADKGEVGVEETEARPQSPWRDDSQGVDDVAAVIGNLDQFLDVWDVDMEMDRNRTELDKAAERHGVQSNTDMGILQGVGIW
ncbi:hypothetical protein HD806DRAFT_331240 [Xylariaceae sp. AK1471]|nr:hypothetical protein HD806DRAFT_331240 [Xylariaceae sp. AK1471]